MEVAVFTLQDMRQLGMEIFARKGDLLAGFEERPLGKTTLFEKRIDGKLVNEVVVAPDDIIRVKKVKGQLLDQAVGDGLEVAAQQYERTLLQEKVFRLRDNLCLRLLAEAGYYYDEKKSNLKGYSLASQIFTPDFSLRSEGEQGFMVTTYGDYPAISSRVERYKYEGKFFDEVGKRIPFEETFTKELTNSEIRNFIRSQIPETTVRLVVSIHTISRPLSGNATECNTNMTWSINIAGDVDYINQTLGNLNSITAVNWDIKLGTQSSIDFGYGKGQPIRLPLQLITPTVRLLAFDAIKELQGSDEQPEQPTVR
jgi:hypothetical protein